MKHESRGGSVPYGRELIRYSVRRSPLRKSGRVAIHVEPGGRVVVDAPEESTDAQIRIAVSARARWIHTHLEKIRERRKHVLPREYVSGESLIYLGRRYRLKVKTHASPGALVRMRGSFIEVSIKARSAAGVKSALEAWYRERARAVFGERLATTAKSLRWLKDTPEFRLQRMTAQWGSCSPAGCLTLNPQLVKAPRECIDYVLLHELCHLRVHNHGPAFYRLLDRHLPGWQSIKSRLDDQAEVILNV